MFRRVTPAVSCPNATTWPGRYALYATIAHPAGGPRYPDEVVRIDVLPYVCTDRLCIAVTFSSEDYWLSSEFAEVTVT